MPSLHVALPLLLSFWFFRERWRIPALAMLAYSALVACEVVFSGEHYVIDAAGAAVVAGFIAFAVKIDCRRAFSRLPRRLERAIGPPPVFQPAASLGPDRTTDRSGVAPGLTSRPGVILAITAALIVLVSVNALGFFAASTSIPIRDNTLTSEALAPPTNLTAIGGSSITLSWSSPAG
jgi:hypothetical protein